MADKDPASQSLLFPSDSSSFMEAIAKATAEGSWGDVCFVVKSQAMVGSAYTCVYADLNILRANGADRLADQIVQSGKHTLGAALNSFHQPASTAQQIAPISTNGAADRSDPWQHHHKLFYPISNIAVTTWRAVMVYIQTGHIEFAPLSSSHEDDRYEQVDDEGAEGDSFDDLLDAQGQIKKAVEQGSCAANRGPVERMSTLSASPKSVYRAARKYGLKQLMELSCEAMKQQITPDNILIELFDLFTFKYPQIREQRLEYALEHWNEIRSRDKHGLAKILLSSADRPGAIEVFNSIIARTSIKEETD